MRSKKIGLHPLLILLAVALVSGLFVLSCGDDEATAVPGAGDATAAEAAAVQAAAAAEAAAEAVELAQLAQLSALSAGAEGTQETEALEAALAAAAEAAEAAATLLAELTASAEDVEEAAQPGGPKYGGTLTMGIVANHATLDPLLVQTDLDLTITQATYDNLLMIQPDLITKPELATSWEANDDLSSYTFQLRRGVKFHHGKEFKAEDVLFTFERLLDPVFDSPQRSTFATIQEIIVLDDYTIRFDLDGPNGFFPASLSHFAGRILPADVDASRLTLEEFGTGPFKILEHLAGERTTMVRNDDYWEEGKPYLDELVILAIPEAAARAAALKSGDVDLVFQLEVQSISGIESNPDTVVLKTSSTSLIALDMDNRFPPFDNKLVRQAMQAATDREAIRQAMFFGLGSPAYDHPVPPNDPRFAPQYKPLDYNPDLARSLLEQAGYPDGLDIELYTADLGSGMLELAVAFKESAAPAGIRVDVQRVASDGFWDQYWMQKPFTVVIWLGRANPDLALSAQYLSDSTVNAPRYNNPTFDALVVKARGESLEDQKVTYAEIQRILIDEVPRLVVAFQPWLYGARINVRGAPPHPLGWAILQDAWLDN